MQGIYQYIDKETNEIVYIGKDSYIDEKRRYKDHIASCNYNSQPFNRALQNNPDRYEYIEIYVGNFSQDLLNTLEINSIAEFKLKHNGNRPKFNFTDGGDGICGFTHSEETRKKLSEANSGENHPMYGKHPSEEAKKKMSKAKSGKNNPNYGKKLSKETKKKMSKARSGENHYFFGKHHSEETKKKISKTKSGENNPNWKNYARIIKTGKNKQNKQEYAIKYQGKKIKYSISIDKLKQWFSESYPDKELIIPKVIFNG